MKELSIEEKAKAYDEAFERAKDLVDFCSDNELKTLEFVFPELKESEGEDERIRKALIDGFKRYDDGALFNRCLVRDIVSWLERQGEQKPKFRIGDTIKKKSTGDIVTICEIDLKNREYRLSNTGFIPFKYEYLWELIEQKPADRVEPKFRIGDVIEVKPMKCHGKIFTDKPNKIIDITEESYILDDGKAYSIELQDGWKLSEQKPAWSEEDEEYVKDLADYFTGGLSLKHTEEDIVNWLKSFKDRYTWKPSEEQMKALNYVVNLMASSASPTKNDYYYNVFKNLRKQLKKLMEE